MSELSQTLSEVSYETLNELSDKIFTKTFNSSGRTKLTMGPCSNAVNKGKNGHRRNCTKGKMSKGQFIRGVNVRGELSRGEYVRAPCRKGGREGGKKTTEIKKKVRLTGTGMKEK